MIDKENTIVTYLTCLILFKFANSSDIVFCPMSYSIA